MHAPDAHGGDQGWAIAGSCEGSNAPTLAPAPYTGLCQYQNCEHKEETCDCSDNDCPNRSGQTSGCKKTTTECTMNDAKPYSESTTYRFGDVVRVGLQRFKCKGYPYGLWCNQKVNN